MCSNQFLPRQSAEDKRFASRIVFSNEAKFHLSGKVNHFNVRICNIIEPLNIRVTLDEKECLMCKIFVFAWSLSLKKIYWNMLPVSYEPRRLLLAMKKNFPVLSSGKRVIQL